MEPRRQHTQPDEEDNLPEPPRCGLEEMAPAEASNELIEAFKKDVDRTLLRENLKLTPQERSEKFLRFMKLAYEVRRAGQRLRESEDSARELH